MGMVFGRETVAEPSYKVLFDCTAQAIKGKVPYEIREYGTRYAAQTTYALGDTTGVPFRTLAEYIGVFGTPANVGQTSIDMTAPVSMSSSSSSSSTKNSGPVPIAMTAPVSMKQGAVSSNNQQKEQVMTFYLPAIYNDHPDTIPKPMNPNVRITKIPSAVGAVHRFSGTMDTTIAQTRAEQLRQQLINDGIVFPNTNKKEEGLDHSADYYEAWGYNPPFTIPQFRRNEIWIELTSKQLQQFIEYQQKEQEQKSSSV